MGSETIYRWGVTDIFPTRVCIVQMQRSVDGANPYKRSFLVLIFSTLLKK